MISKAIAKLSMPDVHDGTGTAAGCWFGRYCP